MRHVHELHCIYCGNVISKGLTMPTATRRPATALSHPLAGQNASARKSTNVTLAVSLVAEARALRINVSQTAEMNIATAVAHRRQERWLAENQDALDSSNAFFAQQGLPLARYRQF